MISPKRIVRRRNFHLSWEDRRGLSPDLHLTPKCQERLGHASITTTLDLYSHVTNTMQADATFITGQSLVRTGATYGSHSAKPCRTLARAVPQAAGANALQPTLQSV